MDRLLQLGAGGLSGMGQVCGPVNCILLAWSVLYYSTQILIEAHSYHMRYTLNISTAASSRHGYSTDGHS